MCRKNPIRRSGRSLPQHLRHQLELVVLHPDHRARAGDLGGPVGEALVDRHVGVPPLAVELRWGDHVVVDRPQRARWRSPRSTARPRWPTAAPGSAAARRCERLQLLVGGSRPAHPGALVGAHHRLERRDQPAGGGPPVHAAVGVLDPVDRQPVGHDHEGRLARRWVLLFAALIALDPSRTCPCSALRSGLTGSGHGPARAAYDRRRRGAAGDPRRPGRHADRARLRRHPGADRRRPGPGVRRSRRRRRARPAGAAARRRGGDHRPPGRGPPYAWAASTPCPGWGRWWCSVSTAWSGGTPPGTPTRCRPSPDAIVAVAEELPGLLASLGLAEVRIEHKGRAIGVHTRTLADPAGGLRPARGARPGAGRAARAAGGAGEERVGDPGLRDGQGRRPARGRGRDRGPARGVRR